MISIVTTYHNRLEQFLATLSSIAHFNTYNDVEVICVDDRSEQDQFIHSLGDTYSFLKVLRIEKRDSFNPCIPYNIGFAHASGDKIIIQNAECMHCGDILSVVREQLTDDNYLSFGCYSCDQIISKKYVQLGYNENFDIIKRSILGGVQRSLTHLQNCWYNHSVYNPSNLHFTTAITRDNLDKLCGFDEQYALGLDYDDNDLLLRVKRLGLKVVSVDDPFTAHLWHPSSYKSYVISGEEFNAVELRAVNHKLFCKAVTSSHVESTRHEYYHGSRN